VNYASMLLSLSLAIFLATNLLLSLIAIVTWRMSHRCLQAAPAAQRARALLLLGSLPAVLSFLFVSAVLIPSYLYLEPRTTLEVPGISITLVALLSIVTIFRAILRSFKRWLVTHRLVDEWTHSGKRVELAGVKVPSYRIDHGFPLVAVVGTFRPRLFIANRVLDALNDRELKAVISHERGHLTTRDNLGRWALAVCCDLLAFVPVISSIEKAWSVASETAADQSAVDAGDAVDLASALVRIARMVPGSGRLAVPSVALLIDLDTANVASRVEALLASDNQNKVQPAVSIEDTILWGISALAALLVLTQSGLLRSVHIVMESAVEALK